MSFSLFNWILGFSLSKLATTALEKSSYEKLTSNLNSQIEKWINDLPEDYYINSPSSLFPVNDDMNDSLLALKAKFIQKELPSNKEWFDALLKNWYVVKEKYGDDAQEFFRLDSEKAIESLNVLAEKLYLVCLLDDDFFKTKVHQDLNEIKKQIDNLLKIQQQNSISSKVNAIEVLRVSINVLTTFWPTAPLFTKYKEDYVLILEIIEKATLQIHRSYEILKEYSEHYGIPNNAKSIKNDLIEILDQYLLLAQEFYNDNLKKDMEPQDIAEFTFAMEGGVNGWIDVLVAFYRKIKNDLNNE
jgi:hypothetical protein